MMIDWLSATITAPNELSVGYDSGRNLKLNPHGEIIRETRSLLQLRTILTLAAPVILLCLLRIKELSTILRPVPPWSNFNCNGGQFETDINTHIEKISER
ncbi:MAG: hypothetical protein EBU46_08145 [Nitrosomonadaceae bacterium]|nr:hypothetical protein [Nitrosomonadaceae bacterium]